MVRMRRAIVILAMLLAACDGGLTCAERGGSLEFQYFMYIPITVGDHTIHSMTPIYDCELPDGSSYEQRGD